MKHLKETDLMVGDLLRWKDKCVQVASVSGIVYSFGHIDIELAHCGSGIIEKHDLKSVSPVPLTQDILEANGWIAKKNHVQKGNFGDSPLMLWHLTENKILRNFVHEMEISDLSSDEGYRLRFRCDYVHELQHALRLCGLNDLADNLKLEE